LSRGCLQEQLELVLRKYHRPQERLLVKPDQAPDLTSDRTVVIEADGRIIQPLKFVAALRGSAGRRSEDPPAAAFGEELQLDLHQAGAIGDERSSGPMIPGAAAVEHEEESFQDRGLARAGVPDDGYQPGVTEVDGHLGAIAAKAGYAQRERSHVMAASSGKTGSCSVSIASRSLLKVAITWSAAAPRVPCSAR
jgi:hypothetical protein